MIGFAPYEREVLRHLAMIEVLPEWHHGHRLALNGLERQGLAAPGPVITEAGQHALRMEWADQ